MPAINSNLVPTVSPGNVFTRLTTDDTINIRWYTATDPVYFEVLNRPMADLALRQLIIAKALDQLDTTIGFLAMFPFLIQPVVNSGTLSATVPIRMFWDMHVSIPKKWENLKLARVDRKSGTNTPYTGTLRFIFVANELLGSGSTSSTETALFYADYTIDSTLTYQIVEIQVANIIDTTGFSAVIATAESETIGGTIVFKTADTTESEVSSFLDLAIPTGTYDIADSVGGTIDSFDLGSVPNGTGMLTSSAYNSIPDLGSDPANWIAAFNYPFDINVGSMPSDDSTVVLYSGMFSDFNITVPASDRPTGDVTAEFFPVWMSKIVKTSDSPATLVLTFSTFSIDQPGTPVEFAEMTLADSGSYVAGQIVEITPKNHLFTLKSSADTSWYQEFGRGHAQLSHAWGPSGGGFTAFFTQFPSIGSFTTEWSFSVTSTRVSAYGLSRVPQYSPTAGQAAALASTSARFTTPVFPSNTNRFITEKDEGLGNAINLDAAGPSATPAYTSNAAIEQYGYAATSCRKIVKLVIDITHDEANFYTNNILPRLTILFGRAPIFGDVWYNGSRFMTFNGDAWCG